MSKTWSYDAAVDFLDSLINFEIGSRVDMARRVTKLEYYDVQLFYANRNAGSSDFNFRTNIALTGGDLPGSVTAAFD